MIIYKVSAFPNPAFEPRTGRWQNAFFKHWTADFLCSQDIVSGDEIISDTYELVEKEDAVYEVNCKKVTLGSESFDIGANPSAEEAEEGVEDSSKQVIDVVHGFRLNFLGDEASGTRAFATKKDYMGQLKSRLRMKLGISC